MTKILKNKRGMSYVLTCTLVLLAVMFLSIGLQYASVMHVITGQKKEVQLVLDGYITRAAVENYNALKQGDAYDQYINRSELEKGAYEALGFDREKETLISSRYTMTRPEIAVSGQGIGVTVGYELIVPMEAFGIAEIKIPVTVSAAYTPK